MNAIRNYLDNMFRNLPNTEEVRRAKSELLQMMEDKYEELIAEGKSENEAVGIVISEFGNLDELAESLGIQEAVTENPDEDKPMLSMDRIKEYLGMISQHSILVPLAIALCIFSVAFNIVADAIPGCPEAVGVILMFLSIGVAVGLFIFEGLRKKEFNEVYKRECSLSIESAENVRALRKNYKTSYGLMSSFGIGLCILSIVNPMIVGSIPFIDDSYGAVLFFLFIALGVFLITSSNIRMNGYDRLLELNETGKMSEEFVPKSDRKVNKAPIIICAVVALVIAIVFCGVGIIGSFLTGVFIKGSYFDETTATTYTEIEENANAELNNIKIKANALQIEFKTGEGEGLISAEYAGPDKLMPELTFENGKLTVSQNISGLNYNSYNFNNGPKLTIVIGSDVELESLEMTIDAGDIKMDGIKASYVYAEIDAGNFDIDDCTFRKVEFEVDAGNFNINASSFEILNIEVDAGNIDIDDSALTDVDINVSFGNVDLSGIDNLDDYKIDCDIDAGIAQVGGHSKGVSYTSDGNGAGSLDVHVDAGNIDIN